MWGEWGGGRRENGGMMGHGMGGGMRGDGGSMGHENGVNRVDDVG